jgi:hypothetical protein
LRYFSNFSPDYEYKCKAKINGAGLLLSYEVGRKRVKGRSPGNEMTAAMLGGALISEVRSIAAPVTRKVERLKDLISQSLTSGGCGGHGRGLGTSQPFTTLLCDEYPLRVPFLWFTSQGKVGRYTGG